MITRKILVHQAGQFSKSATENPMKVWTNTQAKSLEFYFNVDLFYL